MRHALLGTIVLCSVACGGTVATSSSGGTSSGGSSSGSIEPVPNPMPFPPGPGSSSGSSGSSGNVTSLSGLDEPCAGVHKLTGRAMLADLDVEYTPYFIRDDGAPTTSSVLKFAYVDGAIKCRAPFTSMGGAPDMPASLELGVTISLMTADGSLQEVVQGTLTRSTSVTLNFAATLSAGSKVGSLPLAPMDGFDVSIGLSGIVHPGFHDAGGNVMQQGTKAPSGTGGAGMGQVRQLGALNP